MFDWFLAWLKVFARMAEISVLAVSARYGWELYGRLAENWSEFRRRKKKEP